MHNNKSLAFANALAAMESGATFIVLHSLGLGEGDMQMSIITSYFDLSLFQLNYQIL